MIISASRRTDIPALYSDWLMGRIRAGYAMTRNPMNPAQVRRVDLTPAAVDGFVFWTKDPAPMTAHLDALDAMGYAYYFEFTLTPYHADIEANLRPKSEIVETFRALSARIGRERVVWRYDPILVNKRYTVDYHRRAFTRLCELIGHCTDTVVISFVDLYKKLRTPLIRPLTEGETAELAGFVGVTARAYGLRAAACCEAADLSPYGIGRSACIDAARLSRIAGREIGAAPDKNQRTGCGCAAAVDLGAYNTCTNGCVYCYANAGKAAAARNFAAHDPAGEYLLG